MLISLLKVYEDAEKIYNRITKDAKQIIHDALKVLVPKLVHFSTGNLALRGAKIQKGRLVTLNTVHARRREVVSVDMGVSIDPLLTKYMKEDLVQVSRDGRTGYVVAENPGAGYAPVTGLFAVTTGAEALQTTNGEYLLQNANIKLTISGGRIASLYDIKLRRELIPAGQTGGLMIFTDRFGCFSFVPIMH
jgi:alpha-mannosidase